MVTIHEKTAQSFNTLGLGALLPGSCVVREKVNGSYELEMSHPRDEEGKWKRIEEERIIYAATPRGKQPFRIYRTKPTMDGLTVNARHIFYDLLDNQCEPIPSMVRLLMRWRHFRGLLPMPCPFPLIRIFPFPARLQRAG